MIRAASVLLATWLVAGCGGPGFLYTDITEPLTIDMDGTRRAPDSATGRQREIRDPLTGGGIRAEWAGYAPGQTARDGGLQAVNYADVRRQSVFGGIWRTTTALVYGTRQGEAKAADADTAISECANAAC